MLRVIIITVFSLLIVFFFVVALMSRSYNLIAPPTDYAMAPQPQIRAPSESTNRENYAHFEDNPVKRVSEHPVSTFSIDVDTGSYSNVRRILNYGQLPQHDAVRIEEMLNYFTYDYPLPDSLEPPFKVTTEIAPTPSEENVFAEQKHFPLKESKNTFTTHRHQRIQHPQGQITAQQFSLFSGRVRLDAKSIGIAQILFEIANSAIDSKR